MARESSGWKWDIHSHGIYILTHAYTFSHHFNGAPVPQVTMATVDRRKFMDFALLEQAILAM